MFVRGCEEFLPGPAWVLVSKTSKPFFLSPVLCTSAGQFWGSMFFLEKINNFGFANLAPVASCNQTRESCNLL